MPADVSFHNVSTRSVSVDAAAPSRLPLGVGLAVAAVASIGLWFGIAAGVRTLFF
jgi:hypothetical protein